MLQTRSISLVTATAATLLTLSPVLGQQNTPAPIAPEQNPPVQVEQGPMPQEPQTQTLRPTLVHADKLIGRSVVNNQGQYLGMIQDVVLNERGDAVSYVVLSYGGVANVGNKLFAVPWSSLRIMPERQNRQVTLNISKKALDSAPGFDKSNWPPGPQAFFMSQAPAESAAQASRPAPAPPGSQQWWNQQLGIERDAGSERDVFTQPPQQPLSPQVARERPAAPSNLNRHFVSANVWTRRLSKIVGTELRDQQGKNIGIIHDVIIAEPNGQVRFAIVTTGGFLGVNPKYVTLPWDAVKLNPNQTTAMINMPRHRVLADAVPANRMPDLNNPAIASRIESRFNPRPGAGEGANQALGYVGGASAALSSAWQDGSPYNRLFNPSQVYTVRGTVTSLDYFQPAPGAADGVRLRLNTPQGYVIAYAGPAEFLRRHGVMFQPGEQVTLTGSRVTIFGRPSLMVSRIEAGGKTLDLYTTQGRPLFPAVEQNAATPTGAARDVQQQQAVQQQQQTQPGERR